MLLFATESYQYFADEMLKSGYFLSGELERLTFPDGERYHRFITNPYAQDVILVGGTFSDTATLELFDMAYGLVAAQARRLIIVIPYFGYSTMERAVKPREIVKAKARALLLSAIPHTKMGNHFLLLDLHSEGIPHYFEQGIQAEHLYAKSVILETIKEIGGSEPVLAATDSGRAKWVESLANDMGIPSAFVYKRRLSGSKTILSGINADVKGRKVVIYDDMVRTGGSLIKAAEAYLQAGAISIAAIVTHLILPDESLERIQSSNLIECLIGTDSHPNAKLLNSEFLKVRSVAPIFSDFIHKNLSFMY